MRESKRNLPLRLLRIIMLAFIIIFAVLILAGLSFHLPFVQKKLAGIAENQLQKKTGMPVSIESIEIALPHRLAVRSITVPDKNKDILLRVSAISAKIDPLKLLRREIHIILVSLENADIRVTKDSTEGILNLRPYISAFSAGSREEESSEKKDAFPLTIDKILLTELSLSYLDRGSDLVKQNNGVEFSDIAVTGFNAEINNTVFSGDKISSEIEYLSFSEKSGFRVDRISSSVIIDTGQVEINNFTLLTPESNLQYSLLLNTDSQGQSQSNISKYHLNLNLLSSDIGITDILYFQPVLPGKLNADALAEKKINLSGEITGSTEQIEFSKLQAAIDNTYINASGSITGPDSLPDSYLKLQIDSLATTETDLLLFMPDSLLPANIDLPSWFGMTADIEGSLKAFSTSLDISSCYGNIILSGESGPSDSIPGKRYFSSHIETGSFDLGRLLSADTIGIIEQSASISGRMSADSFTDPDITVTSEIARLELLDYTYRELSFSGRYYNDIITGRAGSRDSSLLFTASGSLNIADSLPAYTFLLKLENANLYSLRLAENDMRTEGKLELDMSGNTIDNLNGEVLLTGMVFSMQEKQGKLDSLNGIIMNTKDSTGLSVISGPLTLDYTGNMKLSTLPLTMKRFINSYINIFDDSTGVIDSTAGFDLSVQLSHSSLFKELLLPGLDTLLPADIRASYSAAANDFSLHADVPGIIINETVIDTLQIDIYTGHSDSLNYDINIKQLTAGSLATGETSVQGRAQSDTLYTGLSIPAGEGPHKYLVNAAMTKAGNWHRLWFVQDTLILNSNKFNVADNNYIELKEEDIRFNNMELFSGDQQISIESADTNNNDGKGYNLILSDFALDNLSGIIEADQELISGIVNGKLTLKPAEKPFSYNADLRFSDLLIYNDTIFNTLSLQADNDEKGIIHVLLSTTGKDNSLTFSGNIEPQENRTGLDMDLEIGNINLASLAPLVKEQLSELEGMISGNIYLGGTVNEPLLTGSLLMTDVRALPDYLNTRLLIEDEELEINENNVLFDNFTLKDRDDNSIKINGNVDYSSFSEPSFKLGIESPEFMFLNTSYQENDLYYGRVSAGVNASLTGTIDRPVIDITAVFSRDSEFHFLVPGINTTSSDEEGVVYFTGVPDTTDQKSVNVTDSLQGRTVQGPPNLDLTANIELNPEMKIFIVIDPVAGEELSFKGDGNMSFSMKGNESPSLIGRYVIEEGTYTLVLMEVIRRSFNIKKGSYLQWNGDIENATADITANYLVSTSPFPLIQNEISGLTQESVNQYSAVMPFSVNLNIKESLLSPDLNFELESQQPEVDPLIRAKLSQLNQEEAQLNKQIFSLLLFNSFMERSTIQPSSSAYGLNATARTSVSKLLSRQLNNFADRYINFVDLDLAVNSYYQSMDDPASARTDVSVGITREFFDDQLSLKVGGDFNVEGREYNAEQDISTIAGDVSIEYKLDKKGTYRLRAFRKTEYEDVFEGEVHKTGAAFIFNKDFYKLKNLLKQNKKE